MQTTMKHLPLLDFVSRQLKEGSSFCILKRMHAASESYLIREAKLCGNNLCFFV
jgi:hypothetical protein